jgi:coenzyme F420-reducing hydrogenase delta subunit
MTNKREITTDEREEVTGNIEFNISIEDYGHDGNVLRYEIFDFLESKGIKNAVISGQKTYSCSEKGNRTNDKNLDKRIKEMLGEVKEGGLTKDSIAMIVCLQDEIDKFGRQIDLAESTISLIKKKEVFAKYDGDVSKPYDIDQFELHQNTKE